MNFIKTGISLPCEKVDTEYGIEYVYTIPKSFKYMSEVLTPYLIILFCVNL